MEEEASSLSCSTCGERYRLRGPPPFLLPCLQSVCESCLESHVSNNPHCSLCLSLVHTDNNFPRCCYECLSANDVLCLCETCTDVVDVSYRPCPKDAVTEQEVLKAELEHSPSQFLCTNKEDGNQANVYCLDCGDFLCEICQTAHTDTKISRSHKTIPIQEYASVPKAQRFCDIHTGKVLELYDKDCNIFICMECFWECHRDCDTEKESKKLEDLKDEIHTEAKSLDEKRQVNKNIEETIAGMLRDLGDREKELYDLVKVTFDDLKAMVSQREEEVKIQLRNHINHIRKTNAVNLEALKTHRKKTETALDFAQKIPDLTSCPDLLAIEDTIRAMNRGCISKKLPKVTRDATLVFSRDGLPVLRDIIAGFGCFYTSLTGDVLPEEEYVYLSRAQVADLKTERNTLKASLQQCEDSLRALFKIEKTCLTLDAERANSRYVHVLSQCQTLKNWPPYCFEMDVPKRLDNYCGTLSSRALSTVNPEYWEINVDVIVLKTLSGGTFVFDFGLNTVGCIDEKPIERSRPKTAPLTLSNCETHKGMCLKSKTISGENKTCLKRVFDNTEGSRVSLKYGVLTSPDRGVYTVLDVISQDVLTVLTYNKSEEIWPVFGAYNQRWVTVEMQLISTDKLLFAAKSALIMKAIRVIDNHPTRKY